MFHCFILILVVGLGLLHPSTDAQSFFQPRHGYYSYPMYSPVDYYAQSYYPYQRPSMYYPISYLYPTMQYARNSLQSEYERYQELNKIIQQQITGIMNNPNEPIKPTDPMTGATLGTPPILRPHVLRPHVSGNRIYSVTPYGLKGLNIHKFGVHKGHLVGSPQVGSHDRFGVNTGHAQSPRSVQSNATDSGNATSTSALNEKGDDVAEKPAINATSQSEILQLESLNESGDKQIDSRAIGGVIDAIAGPPLQPYRIPFANGQHQPLVTLNFATDNSHQDLVDSVNPPSPGASPSQLLDQIRPNFSHMQLYNKNDQSDSNPAETDKSAHHHKSPQSHPVYSESNPSTGGWLTDTYQRYPYQARLYASPGDNKYGGYGMPGLGMPPGSMLGYFGGMNPYAYPYNQESSTSLSSASASSSSNTTPSPNGHRTAMDYVEKGLTYQPSDWARYGHQWANYGVSSLQNYLNSNNEARLALPASNWF